MFEIEEKAQGRDTYRRTEYGTFILAAAIFCMIEHIADRLPKRESTAQD